MHCLHIYNNQALHYVRNVLALAERKYNWKVFPEQYFFISNVETMH